MPSSRGPFQPRDPTQVSHIAGRLFTIWATREAQEYWSGYPSFLQGIFLTQELNQSLLHGRQNFYRLSHQGSPRILEWVAYLFFRSSWSRNRTTVSWIAGGFPAELPGKPRYMLIYTKTDVQFTSTSSLIINTNWTKMNNFSLQLHFFLSYLDFIENQLMKHSKWRQWHHIFI